MSDENRPAFELITNFRSPTFLALEEAAPRIGGRVSALPDLDGVAALRERAPLGALVFMYGSPLLAESAIDLFRSEGIPVAVWQVDDPGYLHRPELREVTIRVARKADVYFSHTLELEEEYAALGVRVEYLPTAARRLPGSERMCAPPPRDEELRLDYAFMATASPERRRAWRRLKELLPDRLRGRFVSRFDPVEGLHHQRYARVSLYLGAHTGTGGRPDGWGLSERSWEVPLVGGLLLQEDRRHLRDHFQPGVDPDVSSAVAFESLEECAEKIVWLCEHPMERRAITTRAQARVVEQHMLEHRLARIAERLRAVRGAGARA